MKFAPIIMILRTKDTLWNITTKNHQHQRNSKPKHRLENPCLLHSGTLMVWCSLADRKKVLQWTQKGYNEKKSQKTNHEKGGRYLLYLPSTRQCQASNKCRHNWCHWKFGVYRLPHPAYSLDLAPSNFPLFPKLKENHWGQSISSVEEVMAAICQWFWDEEKDFMKDGIQKLVEHWQKCIEVGGDYVENRLCTVVNKG